ncbi:hypothetical protein [Streptosporangium lutulentum]|uniref:Uncharacterized protein n=1 Tax=Streptosporangium lutulentum TaxID=1461250 RepID=A0ABT9QPV5_9ACTN|nr:hypothetical protein [Streptosporangium lutulentum]MDP9848802.1 hypothetical protein [Streptosporangium lutulentum]
MAILLASALDSITIHIGNRFLVTEVTDGEPTGTPSPGDVLPRQQPMISAGPNGVDITSDSPSDAVIHVRFELWDEAPERFTAWTQMWEGELYLGSGTIGLVQHFSEDWDEYLQLDTGVKESSWSTRVQTRKLTNTEEPDFPPDIIYVELYRVQLWPSAAKSQ